MPEIAQLKLRAEAKLAHLLDAATVDGRLEASGLVVVDDLLYVVFDNTPSIGRVAASLDPSDAGNRLVEHDRPGDGYEDIAFDASSGRLFALVEALPRGDENVAKVDEFDEDLAHLGSAWLDFPLPSPNKGLEGLTCVRRGGELFLLGLCEGNRCRRGADGRRPGGGRIQVFARGASDWAHLGVIRLPASLWFEDFSSLAIDGDRLCVVSQESSALWLGTLEPSTWEIVGDGMAFAFPTDADGRTVYCNLEGVAWLGRDQVVLVSDRAKPGAQPSRCRDKDQSVHVFAIP